MHPLACKAALTIIPLITNWMIRLEFTFTGILLIFKYNFFIAIFFYPAESLYWPVSETQRNWINGSYLILSSLQNWSCIFMNDQSHQCLSVCGSKPRSAERGFHQTGRYSRESLKYEDLVGTRLWMKSWTEPGQRRMVLYMWELPLFYGILLVSFDI